MPRKGRHPLRRDAPVAGPPAPFRLEIPAAAYEEILRERRLESAVPRKPEVFLSLSDSWADISVRFLVNARERRLWRSRLSREAMKALGAPEHADRIVPV